MHQLDGVPGGQRDLTQPRPSDDRSVVLDHDGPSVEAKVPQEIVQRRRTRNGPGLAVYE
jgi:hypothetical protein